MAPAGAPPWDAELHFGLDFYQGNKDTYDSEPSDDLHKNDISLHSSVVFKF